MTVRTGSSHSIIWYLVVAGLLAVALFTMFSRPAAEPSGAPASEPPAATAPQ